jgi:hypothetical protein
VPPSLVRIVLEFVWVPWALVAVLRRRAATTTATAGTTDTAGVPEPRTGQPPVTEPSATS